MSIECPGSFRISSFNPDTYQPYDYSQAGFEDIAAYIIIESLNCSIFIEATVAVNDPTVDTQAMYYAIIVTIVCFMHIYACMQLIKNLSIGEVDGSRYSLITLTTFTGWDIYLCFFHFYGALVADVRLNKFKSIISIGFLPLFYHASILVLHPFLDS